jgi:hypothetical protein
MRSLENNAAAGVVRDAANGAAGSSSSSGILREDSDARNSSKPVSQKALHGVGAIVVAEPATPSFLRLEELRRNVMLLYDYAEVLSNVHLYVLADKYEIENLKLLVLKKLQQCLTQTKFHSGRINEFFDILALAYSNTRSFDKAEPLCNMLATHGAWDFQKLVSAPGFAEFAQNFDECMEHLSQKVARRL